MVGLADIPFVGKFVDRISEATVDAMFRGLRYMFCYKSLVTELNSDIGKLNIEKDRMSRKVEEEHDNGKVINDYVLTWQKDVEEIQKSAEELSPSCSCIQRLPIPNPISRFQIGRNAAKKAKTVIELTGSGKVYLTEGIAQLPPVKNMPKPATTFEEFQSRKDVYKKLWDALVNEDSPLIHGIYGMAGVGKTRMMEQFWEDAIKKNIFNKVVRVNIGSENSDTLKLQEHIASRLDCKLVSQDLESRASQLENSLRNGGKILLVLDDIWEEIYLNDIIGSSFGDGSKSKGSKILLTSRDKDVCLLNKCEYLVEIKTLSPNEALYLFMNTVGSDTINSLPDESLVQKVCDECGHLPLLIHAVGKALRGKLHGLWEDAYNQLKKGKFNKIVGVNPQVYTCIKLSIDNLKDEDARACLFLCSLFPEDANISMRLLIQLATGSQLIPDGESRVLAMVHYLKISSLLLDSEKDNETKVHDIIRDVARSIAFTDSKYAFLQLTCNAGYLPSNADYCTRKFLRLDAETDDVHFYEDRICPDLHTLWLQSNNHLQKFCGGFFSMFANLSFLVLQNVIIAVEQFSLQSLGNLGMLTLLKCDMSKTDVSLFPKKLKTLCIYKCELPRLLDLTDLKYLRKLEIQNLVSVSVTVNSISSLSSLEELYVSNGIIIGHEEYRMEPIVMEISKLNRLKSLLFEFCEDNTFQGTNIFPNIDKYNLFVGQRTQVYYRNPDWGVPLRRSIVLYQCRSQSWEGLVARAAEVSLCSSDVEVSSICNRHRRAFEDLKILCIDDCQNMKHLASISHDEIQLYSLQLETCFSKLTRLEIFNCFKMKYLFCNSIAKGMVQLQELCVDSCESMEAIIMNQGTSDGDIISFTKLKSLRISATLRLSSFYTEKKTMHSGSALSRDNSANPSAQRQPLFNRMVSFPSLEKLEISYLPDTSVIWGQDCSNDTDSSFCKLTHLTVQSCDKLEIVIPQAMLHRLKNLEYIDVSYCDSLRTMLPPSVASDFTHLKEMELKECGEMREVTEASELLPELAVLKLVKLPSFTGFWCYQSGKANTVKVPVRLPQLSSVVLESLPDLKSFFHGVNFEFHVPALKEVKVDGCGFQTLFTFSVLKKIQLEKLDLQNCELLETIVEDLRGDETCDKIITLSRLSAIALRKLPNLKSFFHGAKFELHMPSLKEVKVYSCGLSTLFTPSMLIKFQLEELFVWDCELLENILEDSRGHETFDKIITLPLLRTVELEKLPNLKSFFYNANYEFHMPALKVVRVLTCALFKTLFTRSIFKNLKQLHELRVSCCEMLEGIFEDARGYETLDTSEIITLNRVSLVRLLYLPRLKSIFYGATYQWYMPALRHVEIGGCGLSVLFTCSVFREIRQLKILHVSDCESMERIVEEVEGDETCDINGKTSITFSQLSSITLHSLPNLRSFSCTAGYIFNMPKLFDLTFYECPQIEYFSSPDTNAPFIHINSSCFREGAFTDVNDYVRQITKVEAT